MKTTLTTNARKSPIALLVGSFDLGAALVARNTWESRDAKGLNASKAFTWSNHGRSKPDFPQPMNSVNWFKNDKRDQSIGLLLVAAIVRFVVHDPFPQLVALSIFGNARVHLRCWFAPRLHCDFRVCLQI